MADSHATNLLNLPRAQTPAERALCEGALFLVFKFAKLFAKVHGFDESESIASGNLALAEAVLHFDPTLGTPFHVFAYLRVRGAMIEAGVKALRERNLEKAILEGLAAHVAPIAVELVDTPHPFDDSDEAVRQKLDDAVAALAGSWVASLAYGSSSPSAEQVYIEEDERRRLETKLDTAIAGLTTSQKKVLDLIYKEGRSLKEVAALTGIPYRTVRRRHQEALVAMQSSMGAGSRAVETLRRTEIA